MFGGGEVGEEFADVIGGEGGGVLFVVEEDKPFDPVDIGLFGAVGEVAEACEGANLIEQSWL